MKKILHHANRILLGKHFHEPCVEIWTELHYNEHEY
jgi:hypothetical protein